MDSLDGLVNKFASFLLNQGFRLKKRVHPGYIEHEFRIRDVLDALPDAAYLKRCTDNRHEFVFANNATAKIMGCSSPKELIGKTDFDFYPQEYAASYMEDEKQVLKSGKPFSREEPAMHKGSKSKIWLLTTKIRLRDGYVFGIGKDVTKRRSIEEALREEEAALREQKQFSDEIFEHMPAEAIVVDKEGKILKVNRAKRESGDRLPDIGRDIMYRDYAGRHDINMYDVLIDSINSGIPFEEKSFRYPDENRGYKHLSIQIAPFSKGAIIISEDTTEELRMKEERIRMQKLESLGVLAGGIAHDFNNILTGIMGNIFLANQNLDKNEIGDAKKALERTGKACKIASGLTRQLTTFSSGGSPVKNRIRLDDLLKEATKFALSGSKVEPEYKFPDDLRIVKVDSQQISQVITNLSINAMYAMPEGGKLYIKAKNIDISEKSSLPLEPGEYIRVSVKDEGTGIPKDILPRIFEPYFTTKKTGSGLGLAISYGIINKHEGHIAVDSGNGNGTTFHIYLPACSDIEPERSLEDKMIKGHGKVLIMDDEPMIRKVLEAGLSMLGYDVTCVGDSEKAIEIYKAAKESESSFDVISLDLTIPGGLGGQETLKKLAEYDPDVKAIVCSGYSTEPIMSDPEKYGFKAAVQKPMTADKLSEAIIKIKKIKNVTSI